MGLGFSRAKFPDDDHALGPFLGNLPPEILDDVVQKLGWFRTTFAMAGRSCREAVERVSSARAMLTERERDGYFLRRDTLPFAVPTADGDVEALEWLMQLFDGKDLEWRRDGAELSRMAAVRGKFESLTCLRANGCPWDERTCSGAAWRGHLEVLKWAHKNGCPWNQATCKAAAWGGHLEVLKWAHKNGCPWDWRTCAEAA